MVRTPIFGMSDLIQSRTRKIDLARLSAFVNWCIEAGLLTTNPFTDVSKADEGTDTRRVLNVDEFRPLLDAPAGRSGEAKGEARARVRPEVHEAQQRLGVG